MDKIRNEIFTSSEIHKLVKNGKGNEFSVTGLTYINEKKAGSILGVKDTNILSVPMAWGIALESYVYSFLFDYDLVSSKTIVHESRKFCGTPDIVNSTTVGDIKCPSSPTEILKLFEICKAKDIEKFKTEKPEYYWQLVLNSILTNKVYAELIVYVPKINEYQNVLDHIENLDDYKIQNRLQFVAHESPEDLPFLKNDCIYSSMNRFKFEVPQLDKDFILDRIDKAYDILIKV